MIATLDRIHGFVEGWKISRMQASMIARGRALNTEYFAEVMHALRDDLQNDTVVDAKQVAGYIVKGYEKLIGKRKIGNEL